VIPTATIVDTPHCDHTADILAVERVPRGQVISYEDGQIAAASRLDLPPATLDVRGFGASTN